MEFNYFAIAIASATSIFLGTLYGMIFRKLAFTLQPSQKGKIREISRMREYGLTFIADFGIALGLSYFIIQFGIQSLVKDVELTFWVFIGFVVPLTIGAFIRKQISFGNWLFNAVINAICLFVMIVILTYWR